MEFSCTTSRENYLEAYTPPVWAEGLQCLPTHRVKLAQCNTPIQRWNIPGVPDGYEVYIKRDDMTGSVLSGNKVRMLEFLFADAIQQGCTSVITCGAIQSNFCRATAVCARHLGMDVHLLLKTDKVRMLEFLFADAIQQGCTSVITCGAIQSNFCRATAVCARHLGMDVHLLLKTDKDPDSVPCTGNYLLDHMMGAHIYFIPADTDLNRIRSRMRQLVEKIWKDTGEKAYPIPLGGSTPVGMFGYVNAFDEMDKQGVSDSFTDIVTAIASGGTSTGLIIGNHLTGNKLKLHGYVVDLKAAFHHSEINKKLKVANILRSDGNRLKSEDAINLEDGAIGAGYAISSPEELDFITNVARETGIVLDPAYTGKAAYHMTNQLRTNREVFKGKKILFLHTGGMFAVFNGQLQDMLRKRNIHKNIQVWNEITDEARDPPPHISSNK